VNANVQQLVGGIQGSGALPKKLRGNGVIPELLVGPWVAAFEHNVPVKVYPSACGISETVPVPHREVPVIECLKRFVPGSQAQSGEHVNRSGGLLGPDKDVHVIHTAQAVIGVVQQIQRRSLQDHSVDPRIVEISEDRGRVVQHHLIPVPRGSVNALKSGQQRRVHELSAEALVEQRQDALRVVVKSVNIDG
jgi:hypothetical protein